MGFQLSKSTHTALINDDIRLAIDERMVILFVLFDFFKAFDSLCRSPSA